MEKQQVIKKLKKFLKGKTFSEECQVLYFIAEVRKIMELNKTPKYKFLKIFCDWAMHTKLNYSKTVQHFNDKFCHHINKRDSIKEIGKNIKDDQHKFFVLDELKTDLGIFLREERLGTELIDSPGRWSKFRMLLLEILMECSIELSSKKIKELSLSKSLDGYTYRFHLKDKIDNCNIIKIKLKLE